MGRLLKSKESKDRSAFVTLAAKCGESCRCALVQLLVMGKLGRLPERLSSEAANIELYESKRDRLRSVSPWEAARVVLG